uniref:Uncharacterized protein n=1 Tax=Arundo donax TaxID=35708 RepID=A0A0A9E4I0_ARUDO
MSFSLNVISAFRLRYEILEFMFLLKYASPVIWLWCHRQIFGRTSNLDL